MRLLTAAIAFACLFTTQADAKPRKARIDSGAATHCVMDNNGRQTCGGSGKRIQRLPVAYDANGNDGVTIIGGRPSGCPKRYCGCALARHLGLTDKRLNLAWNWARLFPRAHAGPGMAVVWRHHVALIESMTGEGMARLRDYNSGNGLSRLHERSIRGAVIVNPSYRTATR